MRELRPGGKLSDLRVVPRKGLECCCTSLIFNDFAVAVLETYRQSYRQPIGYPHPPTGADGKPQLIAGRRALGSRSLLGTIPNSAPPPRARLGHATPCVADRATLRTLRNR
jgi:hypothetical protein